MVSDNDTDQDMEEPKQTLVCCRCSRVSINLLYAVLPFLNTPL